MIESSFCYDLAKSVLFGPINPSSCRSRSSNVSVQKTSWKWLGKSYRYCWCRRHFTIFRNSFLSIWILTSEISDLICFENWTRVLLWYVSSQKNSKSAVFCNFAIQNQRDNSAKTKIRLTHELNWTDLLSNEHSEQAASMLTSKLESRNSKITKCSNWRFSKDIS